MNPKRGEHQDPLIDEVRQRRRDLLAKYDNDLHKLLEAIREQRRNEPRAKLVDRRKAPVRPSS